VKLLAGLFMLYIAAGFLHASLAVAKPDQRGQQLVPTPVWDKCVSDRTCPWHPPKERVEVPRKGTLVITLDQTAGGENTLCRYSVDAVVDSVKDGVITLHIPPLRPDPVRHEPCRALSMVEGTATLEVEKGTWLIDGSGARMYDIRLR
jgi:hypothetical protein